MPVAVKSIRFKKREETMAERDRRELLGEVDRTQKSLQQAFACFNYVSDPDLIEASVFEINALQARYAYLLKQLKELGMD